MKSILPADWRRVLADELQKDYWQNLTNNVEKEYGQQTIFPPADLIFNAFSHCPFSDVKVVILGQDPYHGAGQAMGLAFSVPGDTKIPPSLRNIYKEIEQDLGKEPPQSGDLTHWADQGVLLLNATLTVRAGEAGSHQRLGWETFTDSVIKHISREKDHVVFLLWGNYARAKVGLIDQSKHFVLMAAHPSPLSAYNGFFDCRHFSKTNEYLKANDQTPIEWY